MFETKNRDTQDAARLLLAAAGDAALLLDRGASIVSVSDNTLMLLGQPAGSRDTMSTTRSFLLVPLTVQGRPFGLLVGTWDHEADVSRVTAEEMAPVNEMRQALGAAALQRRLLSKNAKLAA